MGFTGRSSITLVNDFRQQNSIKIKDVFDWKFLYEKWSFSTRIPTFEVFNCHFFHEIYFSTFENMPSSPFYYSSSFTRKTHTMCHSKCNTSLDSQTTNLHLLNLLKLNTFYFNIYKRLVSRATPTFKHLYYQLTWPLE